MTRTRPTAPFRGVALVAGMAMAMLAMTAWPRPAVSQPKLPLLPGSAVSLSALASPVGPPPDRAAPRLPNLSPFGLPCADTLDLRRADNGFLMVDLQASCRFRQAVRMRHGALDFTVTTSHLGRVSRELPLLDPGGQVSVEFADGTRITARAPLAPGRALPYLILDHDAPANAVRIVAQAPGRRVIRRSFDTASGAVTSLTTSPGAGAGAGVARLALRVAITAQTCGGRFTARLIDQPAPAAVRKTHLLLNLPGCDRVGEIVELKNALPDLKLAWN